MTKNKSPRNLRCRENFCFQELPNIPVACYVHWSRPTVNGVGFVFLPNNLIANARTRLGAVRLRRIHVAGLSFVLLLHGMVIWDIMLNTAPRTSFPKTHELHVAFIRAASEEKQKEPPLAELSPIVLQPPDIVIQDAVPNSALGTISPANILAPRPDPSHPNMPPSPSIAPDGAAQLSLVLLKLLVREDGTIGAAEVVQSCGDNTLDDEVVAFVKANWRFLPALAEEKTPIQYWTTVAVRFGA